MTEPRGRRAVRCVAELAQFYRVRGTDRKVSGWRPLIYTALGTAMSGLPQPALALVNVAAMMGLLSFFGAYGNYWDWRLHGERNGTARVGGRWKCGAAAICWLTLAPWAIVLPAVGWLVAHGASPALLGWIGGMTALGLSYIGPWVRLKERPAGFFVTPTIAVCLFLEAYGVTGHVWTPSLAVLCTLLWLFHCQAELLHLLDDRLHGPDNPALPDPVRLVRWLRRLPGVALTSSLGAALVNPIFLNSSVWSVVRAHALRGLEARAVPRVRRRLWHPVWGAYEFAVYAVVGFLGARGVGLPW